MKLLFEGKVDDFKKIFKDKFTPEQQKAIITVSSEVNSKHKYLIWLAKSLTKPIFNNDIAFADELSEVQELLFKFDKIGSNLPIKDITKYKNITELSDAIKEYINKQRRSIKKVDGADIIYDNDDYTIVHPKTYTASCFYGKGSKWCTASESTSSNWNTYDKDGKLFYFLSKKLPTSNNFYKVALYYKFNGEKSFWDAPDTSFNSGWIFNTLEFKDMMEVIDQYMQDNYAREIEIFSDEEKAKKEYERLRRLEIQNELRRKREESESRREDDEWNPDNITHGSVGAHAWALLTYLVRTENDINEKMPNDDERLEFIESELERLSLLQSQYEIEGRDLTDIDASISAYEDEKNEISLRVDVYDMIPEGAHYDMTRFSITHPDYSNYEWAVGDDDQLYDSAYESEKLLIDDAGVSVFNKYLIESNIDAEAVADEAREMYNELVYDSPESYLDEKEDRLLSRSQEKEIAEYKEKLIKYNTFYEKAEERQMNFDVDSRQWKAIEKGLDKLKDLISDLEYEIDEIEENPDGDWDESKISDKIDALVDDVERDPISWLKEMGFDSNLDKYVDIDGIIEDIIDSYGEYSILNYYDGTGDSIVWDDITYHILNIEQ